MIDEKKLLQQIAEFKRSRKSENCDYLTGYICALSVVEGMIAEQPKVSEWVPVSERLPEEGEIVLATISPTVADVTHRVIFTNVEPNMMRFFENGTISAWMPLPEPFKGE